MNKTLEQFKTNSDLVSAILGLENNKLSKTALGKKNREQLEQHYLLLLDELENTSEEVEDVVVDEVIESEDVKEEPAKPAETAFKADDKFKTPQVKTASEIFLKDKEKPVVSIIDLDIHKKHYYFAKDKSKKILVENLGFGDLYCNNGDVEFGDKPNRIIKGQTRELDGAEVVALFSASTVRVKISEI